MTDSTLTAPIAKKVPYTFEHLGKSYSDAYHWLQDKASPDVIAHLEAENAYAKALLNHTEALQEQLFLEMKGRIKEDDTTCPEPRGGYSYYTRVEAGKQYRVFCRKRNVPDAAEEILLDENVLAEGHTYCQIDHFEPSPDQTLVAYGIDTTGAFVYDIYIMELSTGRILAGPITETAWTLAWAADNCTLFYTRFDSAHRAFKLMRHTLGTNPADDPVIWHETDDSFDVYIDRTRSDAYLLLTLHSQSTTEVRYLRADQPLGEFQLMKPRQQWIEYYVEHHGDRFLIRTNENAANFMLMDAPVATPTRDHWRVMLPHRVDVLVEEIYSFSDHLVVSERSGGLRQLRISAPDGVSNVHYVSFPEPVYVVSVTPNPDFVTSLLRFKYSSLITPESTIDYDVITKAWEVKKEQEIPSGYDKTQYRCERIHARAADGALVPVSVAYRHDLKRDGTAPSLLEGYGSYGYSMEPRFNANIISLLDRGFVYAEAHIRGGSELGRAWYESGRLMHKKNTFTDFIACAEHLIAEGYTAASRLGIFGASAGGLLMGAVANMRPDLFKAIVALVPYTNVITAMLMPELPLTVPEYEQWGNPNEPAAFEYMLSYSPYDNIERKAYPHILAKGGLNDLQVPYWDPAKWVAKLREYKTDDNRLLLITNMGAGHFGKSGRYSRLHETAEIYAFLIDTLVR
ncbi:MAG: S9 family peptidase [Anaerolineae bacterium]|nr:S9 family peptidase [Anaerolineae bacterium]